MTLSGASGDVLDKVSRYLEDTNRLLDRQASVSAAVVETDDVAADLSALGDARKDVAAGVVVLHGKIGRAHV